MNTCTYVYVYIPYYYYYTATLKQVANDPLLIQQRNKQIENRRLQYQWKQYPEVGLPSSIDETNPDISMPVDEEFHCAKSVNFLSNAFNRIVRNSFVVGPTLQAINTIM